jgi:hypothetical protein
MEDSYWSELDAIIDEFNEEIKARRLDDMRRRRAAARQRQMLAKQSSEHVVSGEQAYKDDDAETLNVHSNPTPTEPGLPFALSGNTANSHHDTSQKSGPETAPITYIVSEVDAGDGSELEQTRETSNSLEDLTESQEDIDDEEDEEDDEDDDEDGKETSAPCSPLPSTNVVQSSYLSSSSSLELVTETKDYAAQKEPSPPHNTSQTPSLSNKPEKGIASRHRSSTNTLSTFSNVTPVKIVPGTTLQVPGMIMQWTPLTAQDSANMTTSMAFSSTSMRLSSTGQHQAMPKRRRIDSLEP